MSMAFQVTVDSSGIGRLIFDLPNEKINTFTLSVLDELDAVLQDLVARPDIKALLVTSAKEGIFIAGADLKSFKNVFKNHDFAKTILGKGHQLFNQLSRLPFPTIAVINGACLGGGLEFALACTYRIVSDHPKTLLGLPETSLGIFPGWGGTQRLPRLVGLTEGLKVILSGKPVDARKAWKIKLADAIFPWQFLDQKVSKFIQYCLTEKGKKDILTRRKRKGIYSLLLEKNPIGRSLLFWQIKKKVLEKTKGHYPAPLAALEVVKKTFHMPLEEGLTTEVDMFIKSMSTDFLYAEALIHLFFTHDAIKKDPGLLDANQAARPIRQVGVLGSGTMGSAIAWLMSYRDFPVRMKDINWKAVGKGYAAAWKIYQTLIKLRRIKPGQANRKFHLLAGTIDYTGFQKLDFVVEAAVEDLELKKKILKELEENIRIDTIVATNTSSLTVSELAGAMKHPERFLAMHFFNPPNRMPLVEIVPGKLTTPEVVATAVALCKRLKKTPIVVGDCSGFLVNRIFASGFVEILRMFEEGVAMERLEKLFLAFGMPMSPFLLADEVGNDVNYHALQSFTQVYGDRMHVPHILGALNEKKWYGKKTGKGFYLYNKKKKTVNPELSKLLKIDQSKKELSDAVVIDRVLLKMINEAARCLEEKIASHPNHVDIAMVFGIGFPPFRGGLLRYADDRGIHEVAEKLKALQQKEGERYATAELLTQMDQKNQQFFENV